MDAINSACGILIICFIKKRLKNNNTKITNFLSDTQQKMSINSASKPTTRGSVSVFFGPMFSGKSTTLLKKIEKYEKLGKSVLVVNYAHDNRYSNDAMMVTHNR